MFYKTMKNYKFLATAMLSLAVISCTKVANIESEPSQPRLVSTRIEATTDELSKADFNLNTETQKYEISWASGDQLCVLQQGGTNGGTTFHNTTMNEFTYSGDYFEGEIDDPRAGSKWHCFFPYDVFSGFSSTAHIVYATLPTTQTGDKSEFNKAYIMYKLNVSAKAETPAGLDPVSELEDVDLSFTLKGFSSVIKLNVPAELKLTEIKLSATDVDENPVYLAGKIKLQTAKGDNGMINGGSGKVNKGDKTSVTITRGGAVISDDVYFYFLPDAYEGSKYYSSAKKLCFTFTNKDGLECSKTVNIVDGHELTGGVLYNFGTLPQTLPFPFEFQLTSNASNNYKAKPAGYPSGTTFSYYYNDQWNSEPPTVEDGLYFTVKGTYNGAVSEINALYRVWDFKNGEDFMTDAVAAGLVSGTAATSEVNFTSNNLRCMCPSGGKVTGNDAYLTFNGVTDTPWGLSYTSLYNGKVSIAVTAASNGTANRKCRVYIGETEIIGDSTNQCFVYTTNGGTGDNEFAKKVVDGLGVNENDVIKLAPAWNGQRLKKFLILEWGGNVSAVTRSGETENLDGTHNYDI